MCTVSGSELRLASREGEREEREKRLGEKKGNRKRKILLVES